MKIKIEDRKLFFKKNKGIFLSNNKLDGVFDVLAIVHLSVKESYLIIINDTLEYISRDSVELIDDKVPDNWIHRDYSKPKIIKKSYDAIGYDYISIKSYAGPIEFIESSYFLFNIYFCRSEARLEFDNFIKK